MTEAVFKHKPSSRPAHAIGRPSALTALAAVTVLAVVVSAAVGAVSLSPRQLLAIAAQWLGMDGAPPVAEAQVQLLLHIRLPRVVLALLVGGSLAVCGAALQGLFRNPLADPGIIGISSGAALAAVAVIVLESLWLPHLGRALGAHVLPVAAFGGAFAVTRLVYGLASGPYGCSVPTLLLAGVAINAIAGSLIALAMYVADDAQLRTLTFWSMGSLGGATWQALAVAGPLMLAALVALPRLAAALNALTLGEAEAGHLGVDVERVKRRLILLTALAAGAGVAVTGVIGFVGLVVPQLVRLWLGPDHRLLLPAAALAGASLLLAADLLARTVAVPAELPVGLLTSLVGGPFFLFLLLRQRGQGAL